MSFFLLYFETTNASSTNFKGFAEVGVFRIPEKMNAGNITVRFNGKNYTAGIISDETRQCANNLFLKKNSLKDQLLDFVKNRLSNESVIGHLSGYIYSNESIVNLSSAPPQKIPLNELREDFNLRHFPRGQVIEITQ